MKIRIKGNSIRIRITKSEVSQFCKEGYLEEQTTFNTNSFKYAIAARKDSDVLTAGFETHTITLYVPHQLTENWDNNAAVGFSNTMILDNGSHLSLLLEKDFTCLENRGEDESDNYPNPKLYQ